MDLASRTASRTARPIRLAGRLVAVALAVGAVVAVQGAAARPEPIRTEPTRATRIVGGSPEGRAAVAWALERYRTSGLASLPAVEIRLHADETGCRGNLGFYRARRIDLCTAQASEPYARKFALHELAHAWAVAHVDDALRDRFLQLRGLDGWNDPGAAWKTRGTEQAAEIIAWGLGEGDIQPLLPEPATGDELARAYELLTGERPVATS